MEDNDFVTHEMEIDGNNWTFNVHKDIVKIFEPQPMPIPEWDVFMVMPPGFKSIDSIPPIPLYPEAEHGQ